MTTRVSAEIEERMIALTRKVAASNLSGTLPEAIAIASELPKPIDPDLLIARDICAAATHGAAPMVSHHFKAGKSDDTGAIAFCLAAIKGARSSPCKDKDNG